MIFPNVSTIPCLPCAAVILYPIVLCEENLFNWKCKKKKKFLPSYNHSPSDSGSVGAGLWGHNVAAVAAAAAALSAGYRGLCVSEPRSHEHPPTERWALFQAGRPPVTPPHFYHTFPETCTAADPSPGCFLYGGTRQEQNLLPRQRGTEASRSTVLVVGAGAAEAEAEESPGISSGDGGESDEIMPGCESPEDGRKVEFDPPYCEGRFGQVS